MYQFGRSLGHKITKSVSLKGICCVHVCTSQVETWTAPSPELKYRHGVRGEPIESIANGTKSKPMVLSIECVLLRVTYACSRLIIISMCFRRIHAYGCMHIHINIVSHPFRSTSSQVTNRPAVLLTHREVYTWKRTRATILLSFHDKNSLEKLSTTKDICLKFYLR